MKFFIDMIAKVIVFEMCFCFGAIIINPIVRYIAALAVNQ